MLERRSVEKALANTPGGEPFAPFIVRALWRIEAPRLPSWKANVIKLARIVYALARDIFDGRFSLYSASLVYTTILSVVPILALSFSVLKGLGVHYRFEPLLMRMLSPLGTQAEVIVDRLMSFVDRMNVGVLGAVGLALLLYTALSVVQKIEAACNEIWHARKERPLGRKVTDYLSILLIGPILMFSALGIAASVLASQPVKQLSAIQPVGVLIDLSAGLVPVLLVASTFTFLYSFIPNTRVPLGSAVVGGIVATGIWLVAGVAFAQFVHGATSYTAIYSALASLILFFIWLDVSWLIVLLGAAVSFYHAHPEYVLLGSREPCLSNHARERLALAIGHVMGQAMYAGEGPLTAGALGSRLRVPEHTVRQILSAFMAANLVSPTTAQFPRWVLIRPLDSTPVKVLLDAVREYGDGLSIEAASSLASGWEREIDRALNEAFRNWTLKDLALRNHAPN